VILLACGLAEAWIVFSSLVTPAATIGSDLHIYQARTASWLAGDGYFLPRQLAGPYVVLDGDALYPPTMLLLFVPFTIGIPEVLWWAIPLGVIAGCIVRVRPAGWGWPILLAVLLYHRTWMVLVYGNPSMWALAAVAAGAVWGWPSALALAKPTFAPFAMMGVRDRRWWATMAALVAVSLPFGSMWIDYVHTLMWARSSHGLEYPLGEAPIAFALLVCLRTGTRWKTRRVGLPAEVDLPDGARRLS
jgi:hypothetical protein